MKNDIRVWRKSDFSDIRSVIWNTWTVTYGAFIPEADLQSFFEEYYNVEALEKQLNNPDIVCYVGEVDGRIVAYERTFFNEEEKRQYVASLYVVPEYQNAGFGRRLMEKAGEEAKRRSLDKVWLGVMVQNHQAVEWYRKMGYHIVKEEPFTMGKTTVPHFIGFVPVESLESSSKRISKTHES